MSKEGKSVLVVYICKPGGHVKSNVSSPVSQSIIFSFRWMYSNELNKFACSIQSFGTFCLLFLFQEAHFIFNSHIVVVLCQQHRG